MNDNPTEIDTPVPAHVLAVYAQRRARAAEAAKGAVKALTEGDVTDAAGLLYEAETCIRDAMAALAGAR